MRQVGLFVASLPSSNSRLPHMICRFIISSSSHYLGSHKRQAGSFFIGLKPEFEASFNIPEFLQFLRLTPEFRIRIFRICKLLGHPDP